MVLESAWKIHNFNLLGIKVGNSGGDGHMFDPKIHTCSALKRLGKIFPLYITCAQLALGGKLNFSDIIVSGVRNAKPRDFGLSIGYNFAVTTASLPQFLYPASSKFTWLSHCGQRYQLRMATVSFRQPRSVGLKGLVMPLDAYTWVAFGISFTVVAILFTVMAGGDLENLKHSIRYFILSWQWILCSLCGQYHRTHVFRVVSSFPIFAVICLLSFFLLGTVFYQGSMFSSLVSLTPPALPSSLEDVVDSSIEIITTSQIQVPLDSGIILVSVLKYKMIEDVRSVSPPNLFRILTKLKTRTRLVNTLSGFVTGVNISQGSHVEFGNNSFHEVMDTFAVINVELDLDQVLAGVRVHRDPYIVRHTESPIFFFNIPLFITRGFLNWVVSLSIGQLAQSGLYKLWWDLQHVKSLLTLIRDKTDKEQYRKLLHSVVIMRNLGAKQEVEAEKWKSVSFSALEGIFGLCGGLLIASMLVLIRELVSYEMLIFVGRKCRQRCCQVIQILKFNICAGCKCFNAYWLELL